MKTDTKIYFHFFMLLSNFFVTRSMSRVGTPTDNPVIESKNGWLKKERELLCYKAKAYVTTGIAGRLYTLKKLMKYKIS